MRKPNGYGSIIKLSGKRRKPYAFRITDGWELNKKGLMAPKYRYLEYFETLKDANTYQAHYNLGHQVKEHVDINEIHTVEQLYEIWSNKAYEKLSNQAMRSYTSAFRKLEPLHHRRIDSVKIAEWQNVLDEYSGMSESSVTNIKIVINNIYETAIKQEDVSANISPHLDKEYTKNEEPIHKEFSRDEMKMLWKNTDDKNVRIVLIMIYTGVRITELLKLRIENIHLDEKYMIGGIKTSAGKNRTIPIADKILPFITELYDPKNELLMGSGMCRGKFLRGIWNPTMEKFHMDHLPHDTKHTCETLLDRKNVNENCRKMILGHKRQGVTDGIYTHKDIIDLLDAINRI